MNQTENGHSQNSGQKPRGKARAVFWSVVTLVVLGGAGLAQSDSANVNQVAPVGNGTSNIQPVEKSTPQLTTKIETVKKTVSYTEEVQYDTSVSTGSSYVKQAGRNGTRTLIYDVTYVDGVEKSRVQTSSVITQPPVNKIVVKGTKQKVSTSAHCSNGTYVNSAGNTVCRPAASSSVPSGASAQCRDGTYSYSQSRRGTCSHHGGVSRWL